MKNEFKIIENGTVIFETTSLAKAYDHSRQILKDEAKIGTIHQIFKNDTLVDETISVKTATGKMVMMLLARYKKLKSPSAPKEKKAKEPKPEKPSTTNQIKRPWSLWQIFKDISVINRI